MSARLVLLSWLFASCGLGADAERATTSDINASQPVAEGATRSSECGRWAEHYKGLEEEHGRQDPDSPSRRYYENHRVEFFKLKLAKSIADDGVQECFAGILRVADVTLGWMVRAAAEYAMTGGEHRFKLFFRLARELDLKREERWRREAVESAVGDAPIGSKSQWLDIYKAASAEQRLLGSASYENRLENFEVVAQLAPHVAVDLVKDDESLVPLAKELKRSNALAYKRLMLEVFDQQFPGHTLDIVNGKAPYHLEQLWFPSVLRADVSRAIRKGEVDGKYLIQKVADEVHFVSERKFNVAVSLKQAVLSAAFESPWAKQLLTEMLEFVEEDGDFGNKAKKKSKGKKESCLGCNIF